MLNINDVLDNRYRLINKIGSGGGGTVFKAYDMRLEKPVAIKRVKLDIIDKVDVRREKDILKNIKHKNLPVVIDFVEMGDEIYTVMDFITGDNMKNLHDNGAVYTEKQICGYMLQLCDAVDYLHTRRPPIIHSDIKPANIMITEDDNLCLIDFNISGSGAGGKVEAQGGTRGFGAPEQFRKTIAAPEKVEDFHEETRFLEPTGASVKNTAFVDVKTDIYGAGATMFYLITGSVPKDGAVNVDTFDFSLMVRRVIKKATSPDPEKRYENIGQMKADIEKAQRTAKTVPIKQAAGMAYMVSTFFGKNGTPAQAPAARSSKTGINQSQHSGQTGVRPAQTAARSEAPAPSAPKPVQSSPAHAKAAAPKDNKIIGILVAVSIICLVVAIVVITNARKNSDVTDISADTTTTAENTDTEKGSDVDEETDAADLEAEEDEPAPEWTGSDESSSGEAEQKVVPSFVGKSVENAQALAYEAGITCRFEYKASDKAKVEPGYIYDQSIKEGRPIEDGMEITVYVNEDKAPAETAPPAETAVTEKKTTAEETKATKAATKPAQTTAKKAETTKKAAVTTTAAPTVTTAAPETKAETKKTTAKTEKKKKTTTKAETKKKKTTAATQAETAAAFTFAADDDDDMDGPIER